ncbi:RNA polymerase sigma factor, sigma-70 family [Ruminococcaceae bacterium YRB3002]|nr:RNA polymerase sigma factor, sigma-70 family [Ruminococcaceae bacterium YRB3002]
MRYTDFTLQEQEALLRASKGAFTDFTKLFDLITGLIMDTARKYSTVGGSVLEMDDLVNQGWAIVYDNIGDYDPAKAELSTFLYFCLNSRLHLYANRCRHGVTVSDNDVRTMCKVMSAYRKVEVSTGFEPTVEELAEFCGLSPARVRECIDLDRGVFDPVSYNNTLEDSEFVEFIPDDSGEFFVELIEKADSISRLQAAIDTELTPREALMIRLRSGLADGRVYTLREIGEMQGVSLQYADKVIRGAMKKLRRVLE